MLIGVLCVWWGVTWGIHCALVFLLGEIERFMLEERDSSDFLLGGVHRFLW